MAALADSSKKLHIVLRCQYVALCDLLFFFNFMCYFTRTLVEMLIFILFSAPESKAQVHYCDHALSVVRPSLTFNIFDFFSETVEQNSTKLDRKQDLNALYQVCVFRADWKNMMATLDTDWPRHFRLLL